MEPKHPCFISHKHFKGNKLMDRFITEFSQYLKDLLQLDFGERKPFYDHEIIKAGYKIEETLGEALCKSLCMIMIYTPPYFQDDSEWCPREFHSWIELESERLSKLHPDDQKKGLVFVVVLRGMDELPKELENRFIIDFQHLLLSDEKTQYKKAGFQTKVRELADEINKRRKIFKKIGLEPWGECADYKLTPLKNTKNIVPPAEDYPKL